MAAVAHRLAEANPYRAFHFIPLINGDKPGDEGKIPFTDQWQTSGGVDFEDRRWSASNRIRRSPHRQPLAIHH